MNVATKEELHEALRHALRDATDEVAKTELLGFSILVCTEREIRGIQLGNSFAMRKLRRQEGLIGMYCLFFSLGVLAGLYL